jgi:hypothetical protein
MLSLLYSPHNRELVRGNYGYARKASTPDEDRLGRNISIYGSTALSWAMPVFFSFLFFFTVGRTPWTGDQPIARPLPTQRAAQTQNKRTQTSMPVVGFEPTISVFERAKTALPLWLAAETCNDVQYRQEEWILQPKLYIHGKSGTQSLI